MELTKNDVKMTKGIAILFMVLLHLFCVKDNLPFTPWFYIGNVPLVYYIALFGDCCVVIYCFCSGYAQWITYATKNRPYTCILKRLPSFIVRFWLICIIAVLAGLITGNSNIPGSFSSLIGNMFFYRNSYNGAWWFVLTYILICLMSPILIKMVNKAPWLTMLLFFGIYCFSYFIRFEKIVIETDIMWLRNLITLLAPTGTSLLPYVVGAVFRKCQIFTWLSNIMLKIKVWQKNSILCLAMIGMFIAHGIVQSLFVAIFTGIGTIVCFNLWKKGRLLTAVFTFFGNHSTNIWLTHMFFYMVLFKNLVYCVKYPLFCFIFMLLLTVPLSMLINVLMKQIESKTPLKKLNLR